MNRLQKLIDQGQSVWLDFTQRGFVSSGELEKLIEEQGVSGVTSNPAIFDQAISETSDYIDAIRAAAARGDLAPQAYEQMVITDIKAVADELLGVFGRSNRADGFVSLEVSPRFAREIERTVVQARDFWSRVGRPNLMIKVPGTKEGLTSIRRLVSEGINVNVTLLFGIERYEAVVDAYLSGLEDRLARKEQIEHISSVASFFISRIDQCVDLLLDEIARRAGNPAAVLILKGETGVACAKKAFAKYNEIFHSERFRRLQLSGARPQRILWASTGVKSTKERDVRYVEALVAPGTVTTLSRPTLDAFVDHGDVRPEAEHESASADKIVAALTALGIDLEKIAGQLEEEGLQKFIHAFDHLLSELERKIAMARRAGGEAIAFPGTQDGETRVSPRTNDDPEA